MKLAAYLEQHNISDQSFGQKIGVSRQAVHRYKNFERYPSASVLPRIVRATAGLVTPNDFLRQSVAEVAA